MLERMIIDISKWIAIITIFFVAFACTLFFIYGSFASVLEGHVALTGGSPSSSVPSLNSTANITASKQCSDYFFQLLNQTRPIITDTVVATSADNSNASSDACQQSPNYGSLVKVGPYPGVYYFGRSFRVTLLTIFFTLFGVIGQNGVPVSDLREELYSSKIFVSLSTRIVVTR